MLEDGAESIEVGSCNEALEVHREANEIKLRVDRLED